MPNFTTITKKATFDSIKSRHFAAILMAFVTSVVIIPGMTTYLPLSLADQIAIPILLFPFIWMGLFIYSYLSNKAWHAWTLMLLLTISHGLLSYLALTGVIK
ncbi:MAG: hypothetical protein ACPGUD_11975 [Parashewanella sp.]